MASLLRAVARGIRYAPDRALHPRRRRRALAAPNALRGGTVLFVCHGNICRSPYAEHALRRDLDAAGRAGGWRVASAGFVLPGRPSPREALAVAARRGLDLDAHRSRLLTDEIVRESDLVYVMSDAQRRSLLDLHGGDPARVWILGDLDPEPIARRTIRDPNEQPEEVFEQVYDRIDRCLRAFTDAIASGSGR